MERFIPQHHDDQRNFNGQMLFPPPSGNNLLTTTEALLSLSNTNEASERSLPFMANNPASLLGLPAMSPYLPFLQNRNALLQNPLGNNFRAPAANVIPSLPTAPNPTTFTDTSLEQFEQQEPERNNKRQKLQESLPACEPVVNFEEFLALSAPTNGNNEEKEDTPSPNDDDDAAAAAEKVVADQQVVAEAEVVESKEDEAGKKENKPDTKLSWSMVKKQNKDYKAKMKEKYDAFPWKEWLDKTNKEIEKIVKYRAQFG